MPIDPEPADSPLLSTEANLARTPRAAGANIFAGLNGIRAGWRLLMFFAIFAALAATFNFTLQYIPAVAAWEKSLPKDAFIPSALLVGEGLQVLLLTISALIMSKIERKSFADYGLPFSEAFAKQFWQGVPFGLAMLSLLMALIAALHGFSINGLALSGAQAVNTECSTASHLLSSGFSRNSLFEATCKQRWDQEWVSGQPRLYFRFCLARFI